jgi:hypothetical protein
VSCYLDKGNAPDDGVKATLAAGVDCLAREREKKIRKPSAMKEQTSPRLAAAAGFLNLNAYIFALAFMLGGSKKKKKKTKMRISFRYIISYTCCCWACT